VYQFQPDDGSLVLLNVQGGGGGGNDANANAPSAAAAVVNPAFSRYHPTRNVVYTCTEDIFNNGLVWAYEIGPNGELARLGDPVDAGGTSTCYLTIDRKARNLLCVNYWDSTLSVIPINPETGELLGPVRNMYDPKGGKKVVSKGRVDGGVNHSLNDDSTIRSRQADPHSHALVLDPFVGAVAYVPDLGKDVVREFYYDSRLGKIELELNVLPSGLCTGKADGPRYIEFHPKYPVAYVVNELSSTIAVFEVDRKLLKEIAAASARGDDVSTYKGRSTLRLVQSVKTIPAAFPTPMNTCGRICVHRSGRFVVVSNRGHQSIATFRVVSSSSSSSSSKGGQHPGGNEKGKLVPVGYFHTRGETPRHFQFDNSGQYLLIANQDSDSIAVFNFNLGTGDIRYTGHEYRVPSPNFICCCPTHRDDDNDDDDKDEYNDVQVAEASSTVPHKVLSSVFEVASTSTTNNDVPAVVKTEPNNNDGIGSSDSSTASCTVPVLRVDDGKADLHAELDRARKEIEELKRLLQSSTSATTTTGRLSDGGTDNNNALE